MKKQLQSKFFTVPTTESTETFDLSMKEQEQNDTTCGIGSWNPRWLQWFATPKFYLLNFCVLGILQGAYFAYFVGIVTTLEKRFAFESKISGLIMIADNISPIFISILVGYYGGSGHRPRWIAVGMWATVASCFLSAFPYFIYGRGTKLAIHPNALKSNTSMLCDFTTNEQCDEETEYTSTTPAVAIFFIASFLEGIGSTAFYTIGTPYLDDNVKKADSPLYFSSMFSLRLFGPVVGFLLASACLKYYEDPSYDPGFDNADPRWIGCWWLGFLILGIVLFICSLPMFLFPRRLIGGKRITQIQTTISAKKTLKDVYEGTKRLCKNLVLVCHTLSITFHLLGMLGYYIFMPKYIESQFRQTASSASFFSGSTALLTMLAGIMAGGIVIRKFKPRPRFLTGYMAGVELFTLLGLLLAMTFGCPGLEMPGTSMNSNGLNLINECNSQCGCTTSVFEPVCGPDERSTYFSPCYAGCSNINITNSEIYTDCKCHYDNDLRVPSTTLDGFCPLDCTSFLPYIIILSLSKMVGSTARVGNSLVTLRCVEPKDKSLALGVVGTVLSIFAFIPYPLIFGSLTDSTCLVWEEHCGKRGNCWLYDADKFRFYLHGLSAFLIFIGVIFDLIVFYLSGRIQAFYDDDTEILPQVDMTKLPMDAEDEDVLYSKIPNNM